MPPQLRPGRALACPATAFAAEAAACYVAGDVFFCFFTFPLAIGAFASVPSGTGLVTRCFFDLPAMPILVIAGE